jgi:hypothetical protein
MLNANCEIGENEMKIEAGKFYRTRDGRKVGPITRLVDDIFAFESEDACYTETGRAEFLGNENDLVAEWQDEAPAPAAKTLRDELAIEAYKLMVASGFGKGAGSADAQHELVAKMAYGYADAMMKAREG